MKLIMCFCILFETRHDLYNKLLLLQARVYCKVWKAWLRSKMQLHFAIPRLVDSKMLKDIINVLSTAKHYFYPLMSPYRFPIGPYSYCFRECSPWHATQSLVWPSSQHTLFSLTLAWQMNLATCIIFCSNICHCIYVPGFWVVVVVSFSFKCGERQA